MRRRERADANREMVLSSNVQAGWDGSMFPGFASMVSSSAFCVRQLVPRQDSCVLGRVNYVIYLTEVGMCSGLIKAGDRKA